MTPREAQLLRYVVGFQEASAGVSPTFVQMMSGLGVPSKSNVFRPLRGLERAGTIRRLKAKHQAIEVLSPVAIPRAPDGAPLYVVPGFSE